ncbi:MAG: polysaccharide biosynthesis/export family protein [Deltaproteobacteria bacterium]|nr:polysaccharide biosynthesis/export family protein [bacterium]MCB9488222.1 polysaccharide biosynthesis/export family protein [Deltaproteobacteria bacterium]
MRWILRLFVLLVPTILVGLPGCASKTPPDAGLDGTEAASPEDLTASALPEAKVDPELSASVKNVVEDARRHRHTYLIGPDDILHLNVWQRPDLSKQGVVRDDGTFFVALAGNVPVSGLSVAEAQEAIREALAQYLRSPQVDLEISEYRSQLFFANGQLRAPGAYPITGTTTVLEGISVAGGITANANLASAYLVREGKVVPIDFISLFTRGEMAQNIPLADGDLIYVPDVTMTRVYVLGEVNRPTAVPVRQGRISIAQAIAEAGGFNETTASKAGIRVIRGGLGSGKVIEVDYREVLKGDDPDRLFVEPGDIIYVPATGLAKWDRALTQILPNLSRIIVDAAAVDSITR